MKIPLIVIKEKEKGTVIHPNFNTRPLRPLIKRPIDGRDKAGAYGSVQGVGVQVPRKVLAVPPSGEGEPQCRRDAKVKRVAARQERISGARGLGHSPLPCTVERAGVIARHWTLPLVTLSTTVAPLERVEQADSWYADPTRRVFRPRSVSALLHPG